MCGQYTIAVDHCVPRRTMTMEFALTKNTPISKFWKPKLMFTGVSIMGVNPQNKKFNRSGSAADALAFLNLYAFIVAVSDIRQLGWHPTG